MRHYVPYFQLLHNCSAMALYNFERMYSYQVNSYIKDEIIPEEW